MNWPGLIAPAAPDWRPPFRTPDERLLWVGQASRAPLALRWPDAIHTGIGLVVLVIGWNLLRGGGFLGSGAAGNLTNGSGAGGLFAFVSFGFVAYGLFEVIGRHIINLVRRRSTSYVLTNQRAVIKTGVFSSTIRETSLDGLRELTVRDRRNGRGTILFRSPDSERWYVGRGRAGTGGT